jgi:hypothetical protein
MPRHKNKKSKIKKKRRKMEAKREANLEYGRQMSEENRALASDDHKRRVWGSVNHWIRKEVEEA